MVVWEESIIGIFNMKSTIASQTTKKFLLKRDKKRSIIRITKKPAKTFILTDKEKVFFSPIESTTLIKRIKGGAV
jgi:hypothetical protein